MGRHSAGPVDPTRTLEVYAQGRRYGRSKGLGKHEDPNSGYNERMRAERVAGGLVGTSTGVAPTVRLQAHETLIPAKSLVCEAYVIAGGKKHHCTAGYRHNGMAHRHPVYGVWSTQVFDFDQYRKPLKRRGYGK